MFDNINVAIMPYNLRDNCGCPHFPPHITYEIIVAVPISPHFPISTVPISTHFHYDFMSKRKHLIWYVKDYRTLNEFYKK